MVRGELPKFAILPEPANWLVKLQEWAPGVAERAVETVSDGTATR